MIAVDVAPLPRPGWLDRGALLTLPSYVSRPTSIILLQSVSLLLCVCPLSRVYAIHRRYTFKEDSFVVIALQLDF